MISFNGWVVCLEIFLASESRAGVKRLGVESRRKIAQSQKASVQLTGAKCKCVRFEFGEESVVVCLQISCNLCNRI